ncbi:MAG: biotin synthase BioB [Bacteroidetes bacterium GWA2_30_7]|nr:MAG: biotin synthase BioB [Bacteroidetes bacterium GWA2_30_7]
MTKEKIIELKDKIVKGYNLPQKEALELSNTSEKQTLYYCANELREHFCGNHIDICTITNAKSGKCPEDCKWCSQSSHHTSNIPIYEMVEHGVALNNAVSSAKKGIHRHSLVTSGKRVSNKQLDEFIKIYNDIKNNCDINLCASFGLINKEQLLKLREVGLTQYHCNLETAPSFFKNLCTTHTIEEKIQTIKWAQEAGFTSCSGGIIGMGENMEQRIELAFALKELNVKSIPINILSPVEGTKLEGQHPLTDEEILTTIALFRFINYDANLRLAGGRIMIKHIEKQVLRAGINAAIVGDLLTTIGSSVDEDLDMFTKEGFEF